MIFTLKKSYLTEHAASCQFFDRLNDRIVVCNAFCIIEFQDSVAGLQDVVGGKELGDTDVFVI